MSWVNNLPFLNSGRQQQKGNAKKAVSASPSPSPTPGYECYFFNDAYQLQYEQPNSTYSSFLPPGIQTNRCGATGPDPCLYSIGFCSPYCSAVCSRVPGHSCYRSSGPWTCIHPSPTPSPSSSPSASLHPSTSFSPSRSPTPNPTPLTNTSYCTLKLIYQAVGIPRALEITDKNGDAVINTTHVPANTSVWTIDTTIHPPPYRIRWDPYNITMLIAGADNIRCLACDASWQMGGAMTYVYLCPSPPSP